MMKKSICLVIALLFLFGSIGIVSAESQLKQSADGKLKVAYLVEGLFNDSSQRHWQQVQNECEMRGWELIADTNVSGNYEAEPTRNAFLNMMTQEPDCIVISYLDIPPIADLIVQAEQQGIGVYCLGTDLAPGIQSNVTSDNAILAAQVMSYVMNRLNGTAKVMGFQNLWMTRGIRRDEVAFAIANSVTYDVGELVSHNVTAEGFTDEMYSVATNWLTKYGNDIDFIWACWDGGAITIAQAMAAAGYTRDDMFTVGTDGGSQAWAYIRSGELPFVASLAEAFEMQVHMAFEGINDLQVKGMKPGDSGCTIPATRIIPAEKYTMLIDETNVPAVGSNVHALYDFYGANPDDPDVWFNQGKVYTVNDYVE